MGKPLSSALVWKTKVFSRWARRVKLPDAMLLRAAQEIEAGRVDADLGGGIVKQRVARAGQGKSGGFRTILAVRRKERIIFLDGFEKKDQANISQSDLELYRELAPLFLDADSRRIEEWADAGELILVAQQAPTAKEDI
jgi:hypothetical protein